MPTEYLRIYVHYKRGVWIAQGDEVGDVTQVALGSMALDAAKNLVKYLMEKRDVILGELETIAEPMESGSMSYQAARLHYRNRPVPSVN